MPFNDSGDRPEKPNPYKTHTVQMPLRLTPEQRDTVEKVSKKLGKSMSDFIRDAVMRAAHADEDEFYVRKKREEELTPRVTKDPDFELQDPSSVSGFDLGPRMRELIAQSRMPLTSKPFSSQLTYSGQSGGQSGSQDGQQQNSQAPSVVINNGSAAGQSSDKADDYVLYIAAAKNDGFERQKRMGHVANMINAVCSSREEAERLAKTFEEKLAVYDAKTKAKSSSPAFDLFNWLPKGLR